MKLHNLKLFLGFFVLLAYLGMGVFGLFELSHTSEMPMTNCPYTQNSFSVCENSLDHISKWQQFSNTTFSSLFIFLLFILGIVLYFFGRQNFFNQKRYFFRWRYYLNNKKLYSCSSKIIKWLSLFENSPSLSYKA